MASVNKVIIVGNLGKDPEVRYMPSGSAICNITVATSRQWSGQGGDKQEKTEWHRVVAWNNTRGGGTGLADVIEKYCKKGDKLYVEGRIEYRSWQDKDGQTRYTTEIIVDMQGTMQLLGGRPQGDQQNQGGGNNYQQQQSAPRQQAQRPAPQQQQQQQPQRDSRPAPQQQAPQPAPDFDSFDDDIPF